MKTNRVLLFAVVALSLLLCASVWAQVAATGKTPYRNGSGWQVTFARSPAFDWRARSFSKRRNDPGGAQLADAVGRGAHDRLHVGVGVQRRQVGLAQAHVNAALPQVVAEQVAVLAGVEVDAQHR